MIAKGRFFCNQNSTQTIDFQFSMIIRLQRDGSFAIKIAHKRLIFSLV